MAASLEIIQQAHALATEGRDSEALALVERGMAEGNAFAFFMLADWRLRGVVGGRDHVQARALFRQAGDAGLPTAKMFYTNLLASGVGGEPDWPQALERLRSEAECDPRRSAALQLIEKMDLDEAGKPKSLPAARRLCEAPEVSLFPKLFTTEECAYVAALATPEFKRSTVTPKLGAPEYLDAARNSEGSTLHWFVADPAVHALNQRIAAASLTKVEHGEHLHILRYGVGQEFKPHVDWSEGIDNQRIKTALVYLNEEFEGGETFFPKADLKVKGETGDAIVFRNASDNGEPDRNAIHAGLPVTSGVKLIASRWIRARPFDGD